MKKITCTGALVIAAVMPQMTHAADIRRDERVNPVAACQSALPAYEGSLRKRPKAIANEGTQSAFITCGFESPNSNQKVSEIWVYYINRGTSENAPLSCTLVDGTGNLEFSSNSTKSAVGEPGQQRSFTWRAAGDNFNVLYTSPALSCKLPPSTEVFLLLKVFNEDIGA